MLLLAGSAEGGEDAVEEALEEEEGVVEEVEVVEVVEADQEIGRVKTAVTPTLRGGKHRQL